MFVEDTAEITLGDEVSPLPTAQRAHMEQAALLRLQCHGGPLQS